MAKVSKKPEARKEEVKAAAETPKLAKFGNTEVQPRFGNFEKREKR